MKLPLVPGEITREWLETALRERHPDIGLEGLEIVEVIAGTSTKVAVRASYDAAGRAAGLPERLIVKGGFEAHSVALGPMYLNEMRFYRDLQPHVAITSPACFYAGRDPSSHQAIVVMEDLRVRGVRFCDPLRPQDADTVAQRLEAMARYHAQTWDSPLFHAGGAFDWVGGRHEGWSVTYQERYLAPEVWSHYVGAPRGTAISQVLHDREWMRRALAGLGRLHRASPPCLCHGDTHLGNLYEDADGRPGFFDAQVARAPALFEVTYHLVGALDVVDRRRAERELLRHYLGALAAHGVAAPGFDAAWEAYRREVAYGLFIFLINETRFQTEAVNAAYTGRFGAAALDLDTVALVDAPA
jgi:Phosphotransferase enzyme family